MTARTEGLQIALFKPEVRPGGQLLDVVQVRGGPLAPPTEGLLQEHLFA